MFLKIHQTILLFLTLTNTCIDTLIAILSYIGFVYIIVFSNTAAALELDVPVTMEYVSGNMESIKIGKVICRYAKYRLIDQIIKKKLIVLESVCKQCHFY